MAENDFTFNLSQWPLWCIKNKRKRKEVVHNSNINKIQLAALALIVKQNDAVAAVREPELGEHGGLGNLGQCIEVRGGPVQCSLNMIYFTRAFSLKQWVKQLQVLVY